MRVAAACLAFGFSLASVVRAADTLHSVKEAFIESGLVPDVLPSFDPVLLLDVTYTIPNTTDETKVVTPPGRNFTRPRWFALAV